MTAPRGPEADGAMFPQPLLDLLAAEPDGPALERGSRIVSRGELLTIVRRLVGAMRAAGLGPGRGVALHTGITPEAFAANLAAHALGCRVLGIRPGWDLPQIGRVLDGSDIHALVGDPSTLTPELVGRAAAAGPGGVLALGPHPGATDLLGSADRGGGVGGAGRAGDEDEDEDGGRIAVEARPGDIARINFTSGSTGRPKACARTYRTYSLDFRPDRWAPELARLVDRFQRFLVHISLGIPVMLTFACRSLMSGGTAVLAGDAGAAAPAGGGGGSRGGGERDQGDPGDPGGPGNPGVAPLLPGAIERHRITGLVVIVPLLHQLLDRLREHPVDLSSLEALVVTGSPASPGLLAAANELLGPRVWQGYGQAESGMISLLTPDDLARHPHVALMSVGRPLPEVEISVRDPEGRPVAPGETGEICVRSPHAMAGYWGEPEPSGEPAEGQVLRDGWLHTRDLGRLDPGTGLLLLTGRARDVILVNAEVCYAGAIERVLASHPDVAQAYVVGVPDDATGEAVHAFVVLAPAALRPPGGEALRSLVRDELTPGHVPRTIIALDGVPVAASGKPDKQALADLARRLASPATVPTAATGDPTADPAP